MTRERLYLFDTTLRDGAQTQGVDFSVEDKRQIALALDSLGLDYIEGGWPGANPTDTEFLADPPPLKTALEIPLAKNLENISRSIEAVAAKKREPLFDAEHFFDGYKANPEYALSC